MFDIIIDAVRFNKAEPHPSPERPQPSPIQSGALQIGVLQFCVAEDKRIRLPHVVPFAKVHVGVIDG